MGESVKWKNLYEANRIFFFTSRITEQIYLLRTDRFKMILVDRMRWYLEKYSVRLYGYVIMSNHFHVLISAESAESLRNFIQHTLRKSAVDFVESLEYYAGIRSESPKYLSDLAPFNSVYQQKAHEMLDRFARHANGNNKYAVWKEQARGIPILSRTAFDVKLDYIHNNPLKSGLVEDILDYEWSSFRPIHEGIAGKLPLTVPEW